MSQAVIKVEQLGKQYDIGERNNMYRTLRDTIGNIFSSHASDRQKHIWALHNVSFEVRQGETLGIIGRNGSGKSTLLKILARVTRPTEGKARLRGRVGALLEVGTGFHLELTGRENIFLSGAILGMSRIDILQNYQQIVDFSGIGELIDTPVKHYSSGMCVRLGFSVAAHLQADILLMDEVLAVSDAEFQKKCLTKIGHLVKSGHTIIFISHQLDVVRQLCHQVIWMEQGKIRLMGEADRVIQAYLES